MPKITVEKRMNYTTIDNNILKNKELSLKARGLLVTMLSLPDEWDYTVSGLCTILKDGKTSIQSALKELEKAGYLVRIQTKDSNGKFSSADYTLYEVPLTDKPMTENPSTVNPMTENQPQLNTNKLNTNNKNTNGLNTKYAFNSSEKKKELKEDAYASFPEEKEVRTPSRIKRISVNKNDYTQSELKLYLRQTYEIICPKIDGYAPELSKLLLETTLLFCSKYYKEMGVLHPILSDQAYQNIAYNYFNPPEQLSEYDTEDYAGEHEDLINLYFKTQYGKNSGHECDYKISHFMSEKVRNHLEMRLNGKMV